MPNPVADFAIRAHKGGIALKVQVPPNVRWTAPPAQEDIMLFAWAPCRPGVLRKNHYAFLGLLPTPVKAKKGRGPRETCDG